MKQSRSIMFVAGEASGDANAAIVIKALRAQADVAVFGAGGPKMREAGMELLFDLTEHAVVGLVEVLKNYGKFRRLFWQLAREVETRRPIAVVLVDFPGFNLRFAAQMKKRGVKVIYYISPQLWAWHASRAQQIERDVALMLTIFPFEKDWYAQHAPRLRVEFAGHPMLDRFSPTREKREDNLVLLLPGSREKEVEKIFPVLAGVVERMPKEVRFVAAAVSEKTAAMMKHPRVVVEVGAAHRLMQTATMAITASGTATMECAYFGCPMVVVYKVNWLTYWIGRSVIQVEWLAMPNVIAGREILLEFVQSRATPSLVTQATMDLLRDPAKRETMRRELGKVIDSLGSGGAAERAAELILREV